MGRLRKCGVSRAFGLTAYKSSREIQEQLNRDILGKPLLSPLFEGEVDRTPQELVSRLAVEPEISAILVTSGDSLGDGIQRPM